MFPGSAATRCSRSASWSAPRITPAGAATGGVAATSGMVGRPQLPGGLRGLRLPPVLLERRGGGRGPVPRRGLAVPRLRDSVQLRARLVRRVGLARGRLVRRRADFVLLAGGGRRRVFRLG